MKDENLIRLLLVDDDDDDRDALSHYFRRQNLPYSLRQAGNEHEAIEALRQEHFDLVLLDYDLKTSTGLELMPETGDTPVVFITGCGSEEIAVEAMRLGASDYLIKDPERNYLTVLPVTIRNVLERKKAERDLHDRDQLLITTLASISDLVFSLDRDGRFIQYYQSQTHPELYRPPGEFLGKKYEDVLPGPLADGLKEAFEKANRTRQIQKMEYPIDIKGNTLWFEAKVSVRLNVHGKADGVTIISRNISERKKAEDDLKEAYDTMEHRVEERTAELKEANLKLKREIHEREQSEALLNTFMDSATESFLLLDSDLNIVNINKQALDLLQKSKEELVGENLAAINPDIKESGRYDRYLEVMRSGEPYIVEDYTYQSATRGRMTGVLQGFKVGDGLGIIVIDTTRRKRLEEQLRQAQKMEAIGSLAGGIAHDFNNILGIIIGYTELAMEDLPAGSLARGNLEQVLNATGRARETVKQILAFSRKDGQEQKIVYLSNIVNNALIQLRSGIPSNIEIRVSIQERLHPILADVSQIHQVIMNICANASQAMKDTGGVLGIDLKEVKVSPGTPEHNMLEPGSYQQLSFSDTGHGMNPQVIRRIFEPYYTTKEQGEGTGMGLAVAHGILKNHGGDITVHSKPGKGTAFHLYFPTTIEEQPSLEPPASDQLVSKGQKRILLIDDEQPLVQMGQQMLEKLGYYVITRTNSMEALELFRSDPHHFDLVVSDQTMPRMTGVQLAAELRTIRSDIPIILCTGFSEHINEENFRTLGINGFVMKPILKDDLHRKIREVLGERRG
jgi:PAS domain S-box-containing protein